jgi:hypothetical protein
MLTTTETPTQAGPISGLSVIAWLCTFFWKNHKASDGTQYPGGYDTVYTLCQPATQYERYRAKYGDVIVLIFATQVDAAHLETVKARGDSVLPA